MAVSAMTTHRSYRGEPQITWYADDSAANQVLAVTSASRCVLAVPVSTVPASVRDAAQQVHRILSQRPDADVRHYITHEHGPDGRLVRIRRGGEG